MAPDKIEPTSVSQPDSLSAFLKREKEWERKEKGYRGQIARLQAEIEKIKQTQVASASTQVENKPQEAPKSQNQASSAHKVKPWQPICEGCGGKNPLYKPETRCKNCKTVLGAKEYLPMIPHCPNCGHTKAEEIPEDERRKLEATVNA